jgi:hypothetical protein
MIYDPRVEVPGSQSTVYSLPSTVLLLLTFPRQGGYN